KSRMKQNGFGTRYDVEGDLTAPDRRRPRVRQSGKWTRATRRRDSSQLIPWRWLMIREHDCIVFTDDIPAEGLQSGDMGTVVHIHPNAAAYEVEFVTLTDLTVAVVRVLPIRLRPVSRRDLTYVRELTPSKRAG